MAPGLHRPRPAARRRAAGADGYIPTLGFLGAVLQARYEVHNSDYLGVPATGKPFAMPTMHLYRGEGDRLAEHWGVQDKLSVLIQVGAMEPPLLPDLSAGAAGSGADAAER